MGSSPRFALTTPHDSTCRRLLLLHLPATRSTLPRGLDSACRWLHLLSPRSALVPTLTRLVPGLRRLISGHPGLLYPPPASSPVLGSSPALTRLVSASDGSSPVTSSGPVGLAVHHHRLTTSSVAI